MQLEGSGLLSAQPKKTGKEPGTWTGDNSDQWGHHQDRSGGLSDTVGAEQRWESSEQRKAGKHGGMCPLPASTE